MAKSQQNKQPEQGGNKRQYPSGWADLKNWMAHGATELANVLVHGHPAPMYASTASPPEQQNAAPTQPSAPQPNGVVAPGNPNGPSLIDQHLNSIGVDVGHDPAMTAPATTVEAPSNSLIDKHLQSVEQAPELLQPEQEIEK